MMGWSETTILPCPKFRNRIAAHGTSRRSCYITVICVCQAGSLRCSMVLDMIPKLRMRNVRNVLYYHLTSIKFWRPEEFQFTLSCDWILPSESKFLGGYSLVLCPQDSFKKKLCHIFLDAVVYSMNFTILSLDILKC